MNMLQKVNTLEKERLELRINIRKKDDMIYKLEN